MNKKVQKLSLLLLIGLVFNLVTISFAGSHNSNNLDSNIKQKVLPNDLHRLDFRIEGKSCASCLLSIQRKLNSLPGVKQAVVMLKRPFGASIIYQQSQIKQEEILFIVKNKEPNIKVFEVNDSVISKMPSLIIPPFVPLPASN